MSLGSYTHEQLYKRQNEILEEQAKAAREQGESIYRGFERLAEAIEYVAERFVTEMERARMEKTNAN